jgi:Flp pilus assembly protein TadB
VTAVLVAGGVLGLGLWLVLRGLYPGRPGLARRLAELDVSASRIPPSDTGRPMSRVASREAARRAPATAREMALGRSLLTVLDDLGLPLRRTLGRDLEVTGQTLEAFAARKAVGAVAFGLFVPAAAAVLGLAGLRLPLAASAAVALAAAVAGFVLPDLSLNRLAAARRREFREATSLWLDLVAVSLAGGAGIEEAMTSTSATGQGWAFARLRDTLDRARLAGEPPWTALGRLGEDLDVAELRELAASLALAGTEGARVRRSLAAKAASLREHEVAEAESAAAAVTERLVLPVGLLLLGFVLFLGFPALLRVFASV